MLGASPGSKGGGSGIDFCLLASPFLLFVITIYILFVCFSSFDKVVFAASFGINISFFINFKFLWIMMFINVYFFLKHLNIYFSRFLIK